MGAHESSGRGGGSWCGGRGFCGCGNDSSVPAYKLKAICDTLEHLLKLPLLLLLLLPELKKLANIRRSISETAKNDIRGGTSSRGGICSREGCGFANYVSLSIRPLIAKKEFAFYLNFVLFLFPPVVVVESFFGLQYTESHFVAIYIVRF